MDDQFDGGVTRMGGAAELAARKRARVRIAAIRRTAHGLIEHTFRTYLRATVRFASPVLLRVLESEGISLEVVIARLRPPWGWPEPGVATHAFRHAVAHTYLPPDRKRKRAGPDQKGSGVPAGDGVDVLRLTVREASHPGGLLAVVVGDGCVDIVMDLGTCMLTSRSGLGFLRIDGPLPEVLADGCIGHPVEHVVDHPLLRSQGWTVDRVDRTRSGAGSWTLVFATGQEPVILSGRS